MKNAGKYLYELFNLFFPASCVACDKNLIRNEEYICLNCLYDIPRTNFHKLQDNMISRIFWANKGFENATGFYYFSKGSKFQSILHKLKYQNKPEIGYQIGKLYASEIKNSSYNNVDTIIPVPLHNKKLRKRGYNQSEMIAKGVAEIFCKNVDSTSVIRKIFTETQTKKNFEDRQKNVDSVFFVTNTEALKNKHVLIIDDVVTTGATLNSLTKTILEVENTKVSILVIAVGN